MDSDDQLFDKIFEFKMMAAKAAAKQKTLMGKI